jgi:hypothetical protein
MSDMCHTVDWRDDEFIRVPVLMRCVRSSRMTVRAAMPAIRSSMVVNPRLLGHSRRHRGRPSIGGDHDAPRDQIHTIDSCIAKQADPKPSIRRFVKILALDSHDHGCPVQDGLMVEKRVLV